MAHHLLRKARANSITRRSRRRKRSLVWAAAVGVDEERIYGTQNAYTNSPALLAYGSGAWPIAIGTYYSISSVTTTAAVPKMAKCR